PATHFPYTTLFRSCRGGKTAEYHHDGVHGLWRYYRELCRAEPGSGKDGPGEERSEVHADHDPALECGYDGSGIFLREIHDASVRQRIRNGSDRCSGD